MLNYSYRQRSVLSCACTLLLFSNTLPAVLDEDGDGMSDVWQRVYNIASFDTLSDPDKDGRNNLEEAQAGTNPNDKNDFYRTINYQIKPEVGTIDLTWRSLEDRSYNIEKSQDLVSWNSFHQMRGILGEQTSISLNLPTFPLNDQFESRLPTSTVAAQTTGNNKDASAQVGEPDNPSVAGEHSVWWTWKSSVAGKVTITTNGSDFDTTLAVYTGDTLATLVLIGANDDGGDGRQSAVTFTADPSKVYSIQVNGYNNYTGNITLNHPTSAGTFDQPVASDGKPKKMFFRVTGDRFSDRDMDGDELVVWEERLLGTDPTKADTDGDGMSDSHEFIHDFNPQDPADGALDADGDGISNADELATGTHPRNPDSNGNGINDGLEDPDGDTLTNAAEVNIYSTNPQNPDTDGDQMPDNWEIEQGLDPNDDDGDDGQDGDPDGDGISNFDEYLNGTDPNSSDTDGDGVNDATEISQGSDPANDTDGGESPEEPLKELSFRVGDPSESHSENWLMCIRGIGADPDTRNLKVKGKDFGVMSDPTPFKLRVGKSYEITILHQGTKPDKGSDYDWEATIDNLPGGVADVGNVGNQTTPNEVFIVGGSWLVDNREAVLTKLKEGNNNNIVQGKKTYLRPLELREHATESGFDNFERLLPEEQHERPWLMVPGDNDRDNKCQLLGLGTLELKLEVKDGGIKVTPEETGQTDPLIMSFRGTDKGDNSWLEIAESSKILDLVVYKKKTVTVAPHAITSSNDDVDLQNIEQGKGLPNQVCISRKGSILYSSPNSAKPNGDDVILNGAITTGADGICDTNCHPNDEKHIDVGDGKADVTFITGGANGVVGTRANSSDDYVKDGEKNIAISTGSDGIRDTGAPPAQLLPQNVPTSQELEDYLNEIFGKQANIFFEVSPMNHQTVDFDIGDPNNKHPEYTKMGVNVSLDYQVGELTAEEQVLQDAAFNGDVDFNLYFIPTKLRDHHILSAKYYSDESLGYAKRRVDQNQKLLRTPYLSANGDNPKLSLLHASAHEIAHIAFPGVDNNLGLRHPIHAAKKIRVIGNDMFTMKKMEDNERRLMWGSVSSYSITTGTDSKINPITNRPYALLLKDECDILHGRTNHNQ